MVPVPDTENPVPPVFHTVPEVDKVHVPEPTARVLAAAPDAPCTFDDNVTLYVTALNVPASNVMPKEVLFDVKASARTTEPPKQIMLKPCVNVLPALVIVWVVFLPEKKNISAPDKLTVELLVQFP